MDSNLKKRLVSLEYRQDFGSEAIKYDLARALVEARKQAGLTQGELAYLFKVSPAYIAKLENGKANPTISRIGALLATKGLCLQFVLAPLQPIDKDRANG